jgi:hypothetical protein
VRFLVPFLLFPAFAALAPGGPARAQLPAKVAERTPAQLATDVFEADYGRLLAGNFGKILQDSASESCLRAKGLAPGLLPELGLGILERSARAQFEIASRHIDSKKFEAALAARAGPKALADITRLRSDRDVAKYIEISRPGRFARLADDVVENISRYARVARVALKGEPSPLRSREPVLLDASPARASFEESQRYLKAHPTPAMKRWAQLSQAAAQAQREATDQVAMKTFGPADLMPKLGAELAAVCVGTR